MNASRILFIFILSFTYFTMNQSFLTRSWQISRIITRRNHIYGLPKFEPKVLTSEEIKVMGHPLVMSFENLSVAMNGTGKAKVFWDLLCLGKNPLIEKGEVDSDPNFLSIKAKGRLLEILDGRPLIPGELTEKTFSDCGTKKMLIKQFDGQSIESVLIPSTKYDRTTLCVSSQIGCDRGCKFCLTGKMGLIRNLSAPEIIAQVILAMNVSRQENMPPMRNVVFMGMGDAGRNMEQVSQAVRVLCNPKLGKMSGSKITVSTVGPSPEVFDAITKLPCSVAWSLHTPDPALRKKLIPSSYKYTPLQLREALVAAFVANRRQQERILMIAVTLIDGINDSAEDAQALVDFVTPMLVDVKKIFIDLIPYNDINFEGFAQPVHEKVNAFQDIITRSGMFCSVRMPRGDKDSAACGQLATKVIRKPRANRSVSAVSATMTDNTTTIESINVSL